MVCTLLYNLGLTEYFRIKIATPDHRGVVLPRLLRPEAKGRIQA